MKDYNKLIRETPLENNQIEYEAYFHLKNFQLNNEYKVDNLHFEVHDRIEQEDFEVVYFQGTDMYGFKKK